jgi:hypothetical protein
MLLLELTDILGLAKFARKLAAAQKFRNWGFMTFSTPSSERFVSFPACASLAITAVNRRPQRAETGQ